MQRIKWSHAWQMLGLLAVLVFLSSCSIGVVGGIETATPTITATVPSPMFTPTSTDTPLPPMFTPTPTDTPLPPTFTPTSTDTPLPPTSTPLALSLMCDGETVKIPANAITISIVYGPEFTEYMEEVMHRFNCANAQNKQETAVVYVTGEEVPSGEAADRISMSDLEPNRLRPTIYIPSSRLWLLLVNAEGKDIFDVDNAPASAIAPVVIAIWESHLQALQAEYGQAIGWRELLALFQAENGWQSVGLAQKAIDYGHTNPYVSSTGLSAWIMEFYAAARYCAEQSEEQLLTIELVNDDKVLKCVRQIEQAIKHYSSTTTTFREYIAAGPSYVSIVPLEENDLILINEGKTDLGKPPEKLVALYPNDGTFLNEHPLAIPNAEWVLPEQRLAAERFIFFVGMREIQELAMEYTFRPADPAIPLTARFGLENGIIPTQPLLLDMPAPKVLQTIQSKWDLIKKQAEIVLLIDVSDSMNDAVTISDGNNGEKKITKLQQAQLAAQNFLQEQPDSNRVSLITFNSIITTVHNSCIIEECKKELSEKISSLTASGGTRLFGALIDTIKGLSQITDTNNIKAIVVISDGKDNFIGEVDDVIQEIQITQKTRSPVLVIPIASAYTGTNEAQRAEFQEALDDLNAIAEVARTRVFEGNVSDLIDLLHRIGQYF